MTGLEPTPYTGVENLEVMREAVNYNRYLQSLVERHAAGAKRVIDFGAGSGTFAIPCAAAGFALTAVEPDEQLRALLAAAGVDAVADVAALANEAFHYAYTLNVLEHIEDDVEALRVLRAKLVLRGSLEAAGFEVLELRYADSLGFAATLLFKAIDNGRGDVNRSLLRLYDRLAFPVSRALDALTHRWFGKNLLALAAKPAA